LNDPTTVIVVLSGAEAAIVEPARTHGSLGGKVLVQTPMTCFDGTAASALDGNGAIVALPAELAGFATARWTD
jgi:chemotaxis response regulator CheB